MDLALNLLWLCPPAAGLMLAAYVLVDARRTRAAVSTSETVDPRVVYVTRTGVRREWRRVVMQLLLLLAMSVVVFGRHRIATDTRILVRNAAMAAVSLIIARQSVCDVANRRYLSRSFRAEAMARFEATLAGAGPGRAGPNEGGR